MSTNGTALDASAPHEAGGQILLEALAFYRAAEALGMYGVANQFILVGCAEKIVDMRKAGVQINPLVSRAARRKLKLEDDEA